MIESPEKSQKNTYSIFKERPFFKKGDSYTRGKLKRGQVQIFFKLTQVCQNFKIP